MMHQNKKLFQAANVLLCIRKEVVNVYPGTFFGNGLEE